MRLAYLNTRYPSLSHTFIEREVAAVREQDIEVHPFTVRPSQGADHLSDAHRRAARETFCLLNGRLDLLKGLWAALRRPFGLLRAVALAQRLAVPGIRSRLTHLVYILEAARLAVEMRRRGLRHVHVHMANNGAAVAMLACRLDPALSYSLTIHGSAEFFQVEAGRLRQKVESALFIRCISDFCRAQIMAWTRPDFWKRLHVVHCGIDPDGFPVRPARDSGPLRILTVGRLDPIKGYPLLLEACSMLSARGVDWELDMVGSGPLGSLLVEQAAQLGIQQRITFSGAVGQDEIQAHYQRADVMVISSFMEGIPVVLMEAMACGLAVVATNVAGIPELIDDGINGLLIPPGSSEKLADALQRLAQDRSLLHKFAQPARKRIVEQFSLEQLGPSMAALFREGLPSLPQPQGAATALVSPVPAPAPAPMSASRN